MNFLDMRTIIFSHVVTDIVCLLVILMLWYQGRKRFAGTGFWVFDFGFQTTAMFLIIPRGSIPDWMSMILANTLVIGGAILGYIGLGRFVGKKTSQVHNYALLAVFACVHAYFTLVQPSLVARNLNVTVGLLIICFQCMWFLVWRVEPGIRPLTLGVGMVFGAYCLVSIVRIVGFFTGTHATVDYFRSGTFESLVLLSYQVLFILLTYSLALMVNKRLFVEVKTEEEKFAKTFQSSPYAITLTRLSDGQIIEVNDGFSNISGYQYAEAMGKTTLDLNLWYKEEDRVTAVNELSKSGRVQGMEFQFRKKSGEMITGIFSADIIPINDQKYVLSSISDITERKRAEDALRASEEKYRNLFENIEEMVTVYEVERDDNGQIVERWLRDANRAFLRAVGVSSIDKIRGKASSQIFGKVWSEVHLPAVQKAMDTGQVQVQEVYRPESGRHYITSVVRLDAQTYLGTGWDITERKQAETALRESEEALRKAHGELEKRVQERTSELSEAVDRLRVEIIQRKQLEDILRESENRVRFFASQCLTAQETERKRVAGELHDSIAASLAAMKFGIDKVAEEMKQGNGTPESLQDLGAKVMDINNEVRRIMADLRPSILDDLGIIPAINWFCREYQKTYSHISVEKQIGIAEHEVPDSLKTPIFRISQEAMNNIAKYSKASLVNLSLRREDDKILLTVQDNGQGFDLDTVKKGMGLSTMRERAELSGGSFSLESARGKGTIVRASWPV